jgi:hypothetical protein
MVEANCRLCCTPTRNTTSRIILKDRSAGNLSTSGRGLHRGSR